MLATGARPYVPGLGRRRRAPCDRRRVVDAWTAIANPAASRARCSSPTGAAAGTGSTPPRCSPSRARGDAGVRRAVPGRDAAPVPAQPLPRPAPTSAASRSSTTPRSLGRGLRHLFSGRTEPLPTVATIVYAQGREPEDELWAALEGRPAASAPATSSARARPRRRRSRASPRCSARAAALRRQTGRPGAQTTASSPSRCATPAASVRERTSSFARIRETWTLAVFSAM